MKQFLLTVLILTLFLFSACLDSELEIEYNTQTTGQDINNSGNDGPDHDDDDDHDDHDDDDHDGGNDEDDDHDGDDDDDDHDHDDDDDHDHDDDDDHDDGDDDGDDDSDHDDDNDDDHDDNEDDQPAPRNLVGLWKGEMHCLGCCDEDYDYSLAIMDYNRNNGQLVAELIISRPENEWLAGTYGKFHCTGLFENNILTIETVALYEEESSSCTFCDQNTYQFSFEEYNSTFHGSWISSETCDAQTFSSNTIIISKQ